MNIFQILVIAGLVVFMIVRRFTGQPVQANSFVLPLGITIYGLIQLRGAHVGAVAGRTQIAQAVRSAAAGQSVLDPQVQRRLLEAATAGPAPAAESELPDGLTAREGEVLALIAEGLSNREIAKRPYVSEATVKSHINRLFAKTGVTRPGAGGQVRIPERASRAVRRALAAGHSASVMP